jgi:hypothetical protein
MCFEILTKIMLKQDGFENDLRNYYLQLILSSTKILLSRELIF